MVLLAAGTAQLCYGASELSCDQDSFRKGAQVFPETPAASGSDERDRGGNGCRRGEERVFAVLDEETEDKNGGMLETGEKAAVTFQNVCFAYKPGTPVIRDFTLAVPNGRKVALVGATGSGKTTIVNLLMRFYDIESGEICINGQDIRDVSFDRASPSGV